MMLTSEDSYNTVGARAECSALDGYRRRSHDGFFMPFLWRESLNTKPAKEIRWLVQGKHSAPATKFNTNSFSGGVLNVNLGAMMDTKHIELTQGQHAIVDAADYEWLSEFKWCAAYNKSRDLFMAQRSVRKSGKRMTISMYRVIMGAPDGMVVDHINHDTLDNRRENLRVCTHQQNNQNRRSNRLSSSQYKGVFLDKGRWRAAITINGRKKYLGYYDSENEAAKASKAAAL